MHLSHEQYKFQFNFLINLFWTSMPMNGNTAMVGNHHDKMIVKSN